MNNIDGFVEMEGFLSTTLKFKLAKEFYTNVIIEIEINKSNLGDELDNGFVYMNLHNYSAYSSEEEVLINCMNIFKVKDVVK